MIENMTPIAGNDIVAAADRLKKKGFRLVTITAVDLNDHEVDLIYHFDRDLVLNHLRLSVAKDRKVPSISTVYPAAMLVENEIQDQFGLRFAGLALDYEAGLYLEEEAGRTPFCKYGVVKGHRKKQDAQS